jgi:nitrite reductase (NADH) small subunit
MSAAAAIDDAADLPPSWDAPAAWAAVCDLDDIIPNTGVCALVGGRQIAIVRPGAGARLFALDNFDPFSKAFVISRGIVGDKGGVPKIASPIFKQSFDLTTGRCLDDPAVALATFPVRVENGRVEVLVPALETRHPR